MSHRALLASLLAYGREVRRTVTSGGRWTRCDPSGGERTIPPSRPWSAALHRLPWPWRRSRVARRRATAFGSRLRAMRERATLTQEELAWRSGVGLDFYRRLEIGDPAALSVMTVDLLWPVADVLGTSPRQLFEGLD